MTDVDANWLRQTRRTYFGNAAAQRDFRVQLRGNRSMLLFGLYLAILIVVAFFKYGEIQTNATVSVVQAQRELRDFYTLVVELLAGMVSLVTPALAATTIVLERQRRSLDLVFSAPVQPRYYLVGKIIAVYRYIWMLLILSLPVVAACVVLGGASWGDVLTVYGLLSIHGLLFAAIGLMMSTICQKPVAAVVWTYAAVVGYLWLASGVAVATLGFRLFGGSNAEAPFLVGMSPFTVIYAVGTYTTVVGHHVPNWLLAALASLVLVRLCLLGAGSLLSDGRETANLRINWAIVTALAAYGLSYWLVASSAYSSITSMRTYSTPADNPFGSSDPKAIVLGYALFWMMAPLILALPTLATYGADGAQRQRPNGGFSFRHLLDGTPAGSLPYIAALILLATAGGMAGVKAAGGDLPSLGFLGFVLFALGFWSLFWGIGRVASSFGTGLRAARTTVVAAFIVLIVLPVPFLAAVSAETFGQPGVSAWDLYLLRPVLQFKGMSVLQPSIYGAAFLILALAMNFWSDRNWRRAGSAIGKGAVVA